MKFIRGFFTVILAIVLFILVFALSIVFRTKTFIEKDLVVPIVREAATKALNDGEVTKEQKDLINKITSDKDFEKIVEKVTQNYIALQSEEEYTLSKDDYDLFIDYIIKYKDEINKVSKTNYSEKEIREMFSYEETQKQAKEAFDTLEGNTSNSDMKQVINVYSKTTSSNTKLILGLGIVVIIMLITLINWSFIKWFIVLGIDLIISGLFVGSLFAVGEFIKSKVVVDPNYGAMIKSIDLSGFLIMAIGEILFGIACIIAYILLKKKVVKKND
jgi:hypothetical protein